MTQEALIKYCSDLNSRSIVVVDSTFVKEVPDNLKQVYSVPITQVAKEQLGRELFANIVALGAIAELTKAVSRSALEEAVLARVPKGTEEANRKALELGMSLVSEQ